jgi:hypothetical protein
MKDLLRESAAGLLLASPVALVLAWELQPSAVRAALFVLAALPVIGFSLRAVVRLLQKYEKL